jgi:hypothetical protein
MDGNQSGVSVSLQNPFIMPIKVYESKVVDEEEKELPTIAYSVILNGVYSGVNSNIDQTFMAKQTGVFEKLEEVTIPSDTAKLEKNYSIFMKEPTKSGEIQAAKKVTVSFKVFSLFPFKTTISL